jgi:hypothetical protein
MFGVDMKSMLPKLILLLILTAGVGLSLVFYTKVVYLFSATMNLVGFNLISVGTIFIVSIMLAGQCFRLLGSDLRNTNNIDELNVQKILKFLAGGFLSSYGLIGTLGAVVLFVLMLLAR